MTVYKVMYGPGEPDGVYCLCICATRRRAECEADKYVFDQGYSTDSIFVEEEEVLE